MAAVTWPLDTAAFTAGSSPTGAQFKTLADAWNDVVRRRHNDRLVRTAVGAVSRGDPVYTVTAATVTAAVPQSGVEVEFLGFALSDAPDGGELHVLQLGEITFSILGLDAGDYIPQTGEPLVSWTEKGVDNVIRHYIAPEGIYNRRRQRGGYKEINAEFVGWVVIAGQRHAILIGRSGRRYIRRQQS